MTTTKNQNVNVCLACGNDVDAELRCLYCEPNEEDLGDLYEAEVLAAECVQELYVCHARLKIGGMEIAYQLIYDYNHWVKLRDHLVTLIQKYDPTFLARSLVA